MSEVVPFCRPNKTACEQAFEDYQRLAQRWSCDPVARGSMRHVIELVHAHDRFVELFMAEGAK